MALHRTKIVIELVAYSESPLGMTAEQIVENMPEQRYGGGPWQWQAAQDMVRQLVRESLTRKVFYDVSSKAGSISNMSQQDSDEVRRQIDKRGPTMTRMSIISVEPLEGR